MAINVLLILIFFLNNYIDLHEFSINKCCDNQFLKPFYKEFYDNVNK